MSQVEVTAMSVEERIALMEEIWASFEQEDLEDSIPFWHEEVLKERENEVSFVSLDEVKKNVKERLERD